MVDSDNSSSVLFIMGEVGVRHIKRGLLADLDILKNVAGFQNIGQINNDAVEENPRDYP